MKSDPNQFDLFSEPPRPAAPPPPPASSGPEREAAITKIKKLLFHSGRTKDEAHTAEILAAAIAAKHGIDIQALDVDEQRPDMAIKHVIVGEWAKMPIEAQFSASICAEFFDVSQLTLCGYTEKEILIGTEWHLQIAEHVFNFLMNEFRYRWNRRGGRVKNRSLFLKGCWIALANKLSARFAGRQQAGIEISWKAKRSQYIASTWGETTQSSIGPKTPKRSAAFHRGFQAGRDIEIRPGVNGNDARKPEALAAFNSRLLPAPKS